MRLGLLADIHEAVESLALALRELNARRVEAFVVLGDVLDTGERAEETVALLTPLPGAGVWGNHDYGLCGDVEPSFRGRFSATVLEYFARLRPWIEWEGCRFQHIDPHLNPESYQDLWRFSSVDERVAGLARCPHARVFVGHLHDWAAFTPARQIEWKGARTLHFQRGERYLTTINAVVNGCCAVLDTERDELDPIQVG